MKITDLLKKVLPHLVAILVMLIVSSLYFYPAIEGKSLQGHDVSMNYGKWRDINDFNDFEGQRPLWNNAIFSGMPEFLATHYEGSSIIGKIFMFPYKLGLPMEVFSLFWYMLGFYIMMLAFGVGPWVALAAAVGFGLTTYNIIIIGAGHFKKVHTLALIPPTFGGIMLVMRKKYIIGFIVTTLFLSMQIVMGHVQMTYYFLLGLIIIFSFEGIFAITNKTFPTFAKGIGLLIIAAALATGPNYAKLANMYAYNEHTIRGGGELAPPDGGQASTGLDKGYINAWSSGVDESLMILIPNVKGGKSGAVSENRDLMRKVPAEERNTIGGLNEYWGDQPFSGGPNYIGSVFIFLFFLGLFIVKDRIKYGLFVATLLLILLSMGGNFPALTNLFIDYVPLYNNFRAPVSILAVVAILIPLFAALTLSGIISQPALLEQKHKLPGLKKSYPLFNIAAFLYFIFLLLIIAIPASFNSFFSAAERGQIEPLLGQADSARIIQIMDVIETFRASVFRADVWRALIFGVFSFGMIFLFARKKIKAPVLIAVIALLILVDLWSAGRRYVSLKEFQRKTATKEAHRLTDTDRQIYQMEMAAGPGITTKLEDVRKTHPAANAEEEDRLLTYAVNTATHYRVFNVTQSPFNENSTSNAHRSVGGYHAAKLRRYQDMIEQHIGKSNMPVLNMLNTKYFITKEGLQVNPAALGAAWFVDEVRWADNAADEIGALNDMDTRKVVVMNRDQEEKLAAFDTAGAQDAIIFTGSSVDQLNYQFKASGSRLVVFSEVYYPDWKLYVDDKEVEVMRANYILRAAVVPGGEHKLRLVFEPELYQKSNMFSRYALYLAILVIAGLSAFGIYSCYKPSGKDKPANA
jgi:hypothetical protein